MLYDFLWLDPEPDPDPENLTGSEKKVWIRISNTAPGSGSRRKMNADPSGSGSTALVFRIKIEKLKIPHIVPVSRRTPNNLQSTNA